MELSRAQTQAICADLNSPEALEGFEQLLHGSDYGCWLENTDGPADVTGLPFRTQGLEFLKRRLEDLRDQDPALIHVAIAPTDFYLSQSGHDDAAPRPLAAYKVFQTVFEFDFSSRRWSARPWLGADEDPLLRLPYVRRDSFERVELAEHKERRLWEALWRASDAVKLAAERVREQEIPRDGSEFTLPNIDDVKDELLEDALSIGVNELELDFASRLTFELLLLERDYETTPWSWKPVWPPLATGSYEGLFAGQRQAYLSPATQKRIVADSLDALQQAISALVFPLSDDERAELEDERERLRAGLTDPVGA